MKNYKSRLPKFNAHSILNLSFLFFNSSTVISLLLVGFSYGQTVSNITAVQRSDSSLIVDIYYDLAGNAEDLYHVLPEVSFDNGQSYLPVSTASGDVFNGVDTGLSNHIEWEFFYDYVGSFPTETSIQITATPHETVTDIDGNIYHVITIGEQSWLMENLKVNHYNNGEEIPTGFTNTEWSNLDDTETGAFAVYNDEPANAETYGNLYNWYAVDDDRGVCPEGFHVPTDSEWTELTDYLGGESAAGGPLKEEGFDHWFSPNTEATNETGFTALPGGYRINSIGSFTTLGYLGSFWSYTATNRHSARYRELGYDDSGVYRSNASKRAGYSVRCAGDTD